MSKVRYYIEAYPLYNFYFDLRYNKVINVVLNGFYKPCSKIVYVRRILKN